MARATRSRKIDISEDTIVIATQTPLPSTPSTYTTATLMEVSNASLNTMAQAEVTSAVAQLKSLKAAYREAIGHGKRGGKKSKNKKRDLKEEEQVVIGVIVENDENAVKIDGSVAAPIVQDGLTSLLDTLTFPNPTLNVPGVLQELQKPNVPATADRTARQQLVNQHPAEEALAKSMIDVNTLLKLSEDSHETLDSCDDPQQVEPSIGQGLQIPAQSPTKQHQEVGKDFAKDIASTSGGIEEEDSFVGQITCRSPAKATTDSTRGAEGSLEKAIRQPEAKNISQTAGSTDDEDSFVENITGRSPAKPVSRIEDSVAALDELEDAMDALAQAALAEQIIFPVKTRCIVLPTETRQPSQNPSPKATLKATLPKQKTKSGYASMRVKPTMPKQVPSLRKSNSMVFKPTTTTETKKPAEEQKQPLTKAPYKRPASLLPPKEPAKSTKPVTRPTFELPGEAVALRLKEQREVRLSKRDSGDERSQTPRLVSGAKVVKSTKAPTKPIFELPGEAVSRRKREALEARLKVQEEEERKRREFKARPIRKSIVPDYVPRETVASRARQGRIGLENMEAGEISVAKRAPVVGGHRPSLQQLNLANTAATRTPGPKAPLVRKPSTTSGPSMSGLHLQRNVSEKETQIQRQRAREIYNRDARLTEDMEREKMEREAAAKRARELASERGRQASREWAEKQRAKKLAAGDMGMSAGYGPGGQLGLKG